MIQVNSGRELEKAFKLKVSMQILANELNRLNTLDSQFDHTPFKTDDHQQCLPHGEMFGSETWREKLAVCPGVFHPLHTQKRNWRAAAARRTLHAELSTALVTASFRFLSPQFATVWAGVKMCVWAHSRLAKGGARRWRNFVVEHWSLNRFPTRRAS